MKPQDLKVFGGVGTGQPNKTLEAAILGEVFSYESS